MKKLLMLIALALIAIPASARVNYQPSIFDLDDEFSWYGGVAAGKQRASMPGITGSGNAFSVYFGARMNDYLGAEVFISQATLLKPATMQTTNFSNYGLVGTFGKKLSNKSGRVYGKLGYAVNTFTITDTKAVLPTVSSSNGTPTYGIGFDWLVDEGMNITFGYDVLRATMTDSTAAGPASVSGKINTISIGIKANF